MQANDDRSIFLSTAQPTRRDWIAVLAAVGAASAAFAITLPFAGVKLARVPALISGYQSALAINGFITAVLLFSQFALLKSRALLLLACGYLFTAAVVLLHTLAFLGLFTQADPFGAGPQSVAWLYMIWHAGFPSFTLAYGLSKDHDGNRVGGSTARAILVSGAAVLITVALLTWIVVVRHDLLPALILGDRSNSSFLTPAMALIAILTVATLLVLWMRRPRSVLDVWLMVGLITWLFDIGLTTIFNIAPFDVGYYAGRVFALCAASIVLAILLVDNVGMQVKLSRLLHQLRERHGERERLFSAVVESSSDAILTMTLDGTITSWNQAAEQLFGYLAADAVGQHISLIVPPERLAEVEDNLSKLRRNQMIEQRETVRKRRDGRLLEVSSTISPIHAADGAVVGASKVVRDVTESRRTQRALSREIEERQRVFETSQDLILVTDPTGQLVQVSPSSLAILGYRSDEMIGRNAAEFTHPADLDRARSEMRAARQGRQMRSHEVQLLHKDGHAVVLNWMASWSEPVQRYFLIGRDQTEKRANEAQARQAQKMEAIGQLTGGIAHDFNNILTVITGSIGILADAVADKPELAGIARLIDESVTRGAQLTQQLLAFARKQPLQPVDLDVNALVAEAAKLLRPTLGEHIEVSARLSDDAWAALVDPNQLTTAILNLALNARDAMPEGGKLTIETRNVSLDEDYAHANTEVLAGDYVMIAVSDTGAGIPPAYLQKVFDPFFSTKGVGKGTGLGLSMVFGFVKQSGGHVVIYSEVGQGTCVKLYLPRSREEKRPETAATAAHDLKGGEETILIVEDDALVRRHVVAQVRSLGYATLSAANAAEALEIIDGNPDIDLLFTDVIMPGAMNGAQLAEAARQRRPSLKTLFTSGYTEDAVVHQGRLDAGVLLLAKPYRKHELARMIRIALGR
ncbi:PAS domain S-box protein [Bradyrhizobium sp. STM 3557]|uniref:PAS domain S-box protein n=1 Tax=Bradyrhizobium sp. STM 3557 TaxID=578920 RepID=UPI00388F149A